MNDVIKTIKAEIVTDPSIYQNYDDLYYMCYDAPEAERDTLIWLWKRINKAMTICADDDIELFEDLQKQVLTRVAPYDFDSYLIALEWNREPEERFYLPRKDYFLSIFEKTQRLSQRSRC